MAGVPSGIVGVPLQASSCADSVISRTIHGTYFAHNTNDGRVVFKKEESFEGLDVLIYFWNDSENTDLSGWWIGPSVGGDLAWAFHPSLLAMTPPVSDWNVPHDGPVDSSFSIMVSPHVRKNKKC